MATLAVCLFVLGPAAAGQPETADNKAVLQLFRDATRLADVLADDVWPGFDARRYSAVVTDRKTGAVSLGYSADPPGPGRKMFMTFGADYFRKQTPEENVLTTFHEAFHGFQRDAKRKGARWGVENIMHLFDYAAVPVRNGALFAVEGRILGAALQDPDAESARKKVRQFLAVRKLRQGELGPRLAAFEKAAELNEGLAEYAGARAVVLGMKALKRQGEKGPFATLDDAGFLREKYAKLRTLLDLGRNDRLKFYYTGSAQAFLLDRLRPGWKGEVQEKAAAVQDLLAQAVGPDTIAGEELATAALREYGYETAAREAEKAAARRKAEGEALLDGLHKQKGLHVTLVVAELGRIGDYQGFDPMNVTVLDRARRLHTRMVNVGQRDRYRAEFSQKVLEDRQKMEYVTVVPEGERLTATLDGAALDLSRPGRRVIEKKLEIASPHFRLEVNAGEITVTDAGVVVTVRAKPG
jgi:hypothetical protein